MPKLTLLLAAAALFLAAGCTAPAPEAAPPSTVSSTGANPSVGGAAMDEDLPFVRNLASSRDHGTLVAAIRAAAADREFSGPGGYTLFAPTDDAFARLPNGTMASLMDPANKWLLGRLLKYHLVAGAKTRSQIAADARAAGGVATYRTLEGGTLRVSMTGDTVTIADIHGNRNDVTIADVRNSNGVMHVVNGVLLPAT